MVLSRIWSAFIIVAILVASIKYLVSDNYKAIYNDMVVGKSGDTVQIATKKSSEISPFIQKNLLAKKDFTESRIHYKSDSAQSKVNVYRVQQTDGVIGTSETAVKICLGLIGIMTLFMGFMSIAEKAGGINLLSRMIQPFFSKLFPEIPKNHPAFGHMLLNFSANLLGLDNAATPFGLKAMESLQTINPEKDKASDAQIMFMCLHASGLTLIATSIIGYRAAAGASNPADVMLPCIITSFIGTIAAFLIVGIKQKINFKSASLVLGLMVLIAAIVGLLMYVNHLDLIGKNYFTSNLSALILVAIIAFTLILSFVKEKKFTEAGTTVYEAFVTGANNGVKTGVTIFPYVLGMLVAISLFRNSGLFEIVSNWVAFAFSNMGVNKQITDALPVALLRPFSSAGSRGFLIDSMNTFGADSMTGRLSSIFQCSAESTFYVIAVYFGSVNIKNTRYALGTMLLVDVICVITAIFVASWFF